MTTLNSLLLTRRVESQVEQITPTGSDVAFLLPSTTGVLGKIYSFINSGTSGNILVQSSTGALVRTVYPGTTGQVTPLIDSPTLATHWSKLDFEQPAFLVKKTANQAYPGGTTKITWASKDFDNASAFDVVTNSRFTVPTGGAGKYVFTLVISASLAGSGSGISTYFKKNGSTNYMAQAAVGTTGNIGTAGSVVISLVDGDYVETYIDAGSGLSGTLYFNNYTGGADTSFSGCKIAP